MWEYTQGTGGGRSQSGRVAFPSAPLPSGHTEPRALFTATWSLTTHRSTPNHGTPHVSICSKSRAGVTGYRSPLGAPGRHHPRSHEHDRSPPIPSPYLSLRGSGRSPPPQPRTGSNFTFPTGSCLTRARTSGPHTLRAPPTSPILNTSLTDGARTPPRIHRTRT